jgi:hypothetical protein
MTATITRSGPVELGTRLYHEVHGSGPALLLIAAGIGDVALWGQVASSRWSPGWPPPCGPGQGLPFSRRSPNRPASRPGPSSWWPSPARSTSRWSMSAPRATASCSPTTCSIRPATASAVIRPAACSRSALACAATPASSSPAAASLLATASASPSRSPAARRLQEGPRPAPRDLPAHRRVQVRVHPHPLAAHARASRRHGRCRT